MGRKQGSKNKNQANEKDKLERDQINRTKRLKKVVLYSLENIKKWMCTKCTNCFEVELSEREDKVEKNYEVIVGWQQGQITRLNICEVCQETCMAGLCTYQRQKTSATITRNKTTKIDDFKSILNLTPACKQCKSEDRFDHKCITAILELFSLHEIYESFLNKRAKESQPKNKPQNTQVDTISTDNTHQNPISTTQSTSSSNINNPIPNNDLPDQTNHTSSSSNLAIPSNLTFEEGNSSHNETVEQSTPITIQDPNVQITSMLPPLPPAASSSSLSSSMPLRPSSKRLRADTEETSGLGDGLSKSAKGKRNLALSNLFKNYGSNKIKRILKFLRNGAETEDDFVDVCCIEAFKLPSCIEFCPPKPRNINNFKLMTKFKCEICENYLVTKLIDHIKASEILSVIDERVHQNAVETKEAEKEAKKLKAAQEAEKKLSPWDKFRRDIEGILKSRKNLDLVYKFEELVCSMPTLTYDDMQDVAKITHRQKVADYVKKRFRIPKKGSVAINCYDWHVSSSIITTDTSPERHFKLTNDPYQVQLAEIAGVKLVKNEGPKKHNSHKYPTHFPGLHTYQ